MVFCCFDTAGIREWPLRAGMVSALIACLPLLWQWRFGDSDALAIALVIVLMLGLSLILIIVGLIMAATGEKSKVIEETYGKITQSLEQAPLTEAKILSYPGLMNGLAPKACTTRLQRLMNVNDPGGFYALYLNWDSFSSVRRQYRIKN